MKKYYAVLDSGQKIEVNEKVVDYIVNKLSNGDNVPMHSTSYAEKKYGDNIIGYVKSIEESKPVIDPVEVEEYTSNELPLSFMLFWGVLIGIGAYIIYLAF